MCDVIYLQSRIGFDKGGEKPLRSASKDLGRRKPQPICKERGFGDALQGARAGKDYRKRQAGHRGVEERAIKRGRGETGPVSEFPGDRNASENPNLHCFCCGQKTEDRGSMEMGFCASSFSLREPPPCGEAGFNGPMKAVGWNIKVKNFVSFALCISVCLR